MQGTSLMMANILTEIIRVNIIITFDKNSVIQNCTVFEMIFKVPEKNCKEKKYPLVLTSIELLCFLIYKHETNIT